MKFDYPPKIFFILFFVFFIAFQCSREHITQQIDDKSNVLLPLVVGNEWYYIMEDSSISRHWIDSSYVIQYQDTDYELYDLMEDYGTWYGKETLFYDGEGLCFTLYWNVEIDTPLYFFKFPVEVGDSWKNVYSLFCWTNIDNYKVSKLDAKIKVPAGTFKCYLYKIEREKILCGGSQTNYNFEYYFKPRIGLIAVKRIEGDANNPGNMVEIYEQRLVSYSLIE